MERKKIIVNEVIIECQMGIMTAIRLKKLMESLYDDGWIDGYNFRQNKSFKKIKSDLVAINDIIDNAIFDKSDEIYEKVNELVRYTSASVLGAAVTLVSNKGIHLTPDEVASCLSKIDSKKIKSIQTEIEKITDVVSEIINPKDEDDKTTAE